MGQSLERLVYHVSTLSLSPSPSLSFSGWIHISGVAAHHVFLHVLASKTDVRGSLPGASVRNSTHGKGHEEGGLAYAKAWSSLRKLPVPEHLTPKPESALCSHLHLWLYGGLSSITISLGEGVNLQLQLIKIPGHDKSVSTYKLLWRFSSLPERFRPSTCDCLQPPNCERHEML